MLNTLRYHVGPAALVFATLPGVQMLAVVGSGGLNEWSLVGSTQAWTVVAAMWLWALLSLWIPGPVFTGPSPSKGPAPHYRANGFQFFVVSLILYITVLILYPQLALILFNIFPEIIASCNITALLLCVYLLFIGKTNPQVEEELESRSLLYEFYRGMEVHPKIFGVDVKQLTNCRFGLMAWQLLVVTFFVAGYLKNGFIPAHFVTVLLQTVYLGKFYWWETGYFNTLDITLDRAGYYICWGCIVFVPSFYTFSSYYLVAHPPILSKSASAIILTFGLCSIALNYRVDWEKEYFRRCEGRCYIWCHPAKYVKASYITSEGKRKTSLLLTSGFWGVARHLNYVFEIMLALSWSLPALGLSLWPFLYVFFMIVLLVHRIFRDEEKCATKYGNSWKKYCQTVPYRLLPGVF